MDVLPIIAILVGGVVAGIVNTLVGGGTSIVFPLLLALGIDPQLANGSNRFCVAFQAGAAAKTLRGKTGATSRETFAPALCAVLGSIPGAYLATVLDPELFKALVGWILLAGVAFFFVPKKKSKGEAEFTTDAPRRLSPVGLLVAFLFGVYGAFLGAGIGVLIMLYLPSLLRLPLVRMLEVKVWMVFALSATAGIVFVWQGQVDWWVVSALLPSYMIGGVLGAKLAIRGGDAWVRRSIAAVAALLALAIIAGLI